MKKMVSLLVNLLLSSTLFWGVPSAYGDEVFKAPADPSSYCHMKFPPLRSDTLSWDSPALEESAGNIIDFYGPCDYDPMGREEVEIERRALFDNANGRD